MARLLTDFGAALPELSKAVFSQPIDKTNYPKVSIRPVSRKRICVSSGTLHRSRLRRKRWVFFGKTNTSSPAHPAKIAA